MYRQPLRETKVATYELEPLRHFLHERLHFEGTLTHCEEAKRPTKQVYGYLFFRDVHVTRNHSSYEKMHIPLTRKQYAMIHKYMIAGIRYEFTALITQESRVEELIQDGEHYPIKRNRIRVEDISLNRLKPV